MIFAFMSAEIREREICGTLPSTARNFFVDQVESVALRPQFHPCLDSPRSARLSTCSNKGRIHSRTRRSKRPHHAAGVLVTRSRIIFPTSRIGIDIVAKPMLVFFHHQQPGLN